MIDILIYASKWTKSYSLVYNKWKLITENALSQRKHSNSTILNTTEIWWWHDVKKAWIRKLITQKMNPNLSFLDTTLQASAPVRGKVTRSFEKIMRYWDHHGSNICSQQHNILFIVTKKGWRIDSACARTTQLRDKTSYTILFIWKIAIL